MAAVLVSAPGRADDDAETHTQHYCKRPALTSASRIACTLSETLQSRGTPTLVMSSPPRADGALTDPGGLTSLLAGLVAGQLGAEHRVAPTSLATARRLASRFRRLVYLTAEVASGELRVSADELPTGLGFWERIANPTPAPTAHAYATARLDAELQRFLAPIPLVAPTPTRVRSPIQHAEAAACGDVGGDGSIEVALVDRYRIVTGRLVGAELAVEASAAWADLSLVAPAPLRQPIATASIDGERLHVGITDRVESLALDFKLAPHERFAGQLPWPGSGCVARSELGLAHGPVPCRSRVRRAATATGSTIDAVGGMRLVDADGALDVRAIRDARSRSLRLTDSRGRMAGLADVGAQIAVGDVDRDGQPEVVTASSTRDANDDAVSVHTWMRSGELSLRYRVPVPSGVHALAVCPPISVHGAPIVVATAGEVWLLQ